MTAPGKRRLLTTALVLATTAAIGGAAYWWIESRTAPDPVGRWAEDSTGTRLAIEPDGRLGPSVLPAAACREKGSAPASGAETDRLLELPGGSWRTDFEADSGHHVVLAFDAPGLPGPCRIDLRTIGGNRLVSGYLGP